MNGVQSVQRLSPPAGNSRPTSKALTASVGDAEHVRTGKERNLATRKMVTDELAKRHYAEHEGKPFFDDLVAFIARGPIVAMVVEGGPDTWKVVRTMMGATNPRDAAPGTIRGDLALETGENLVHGSDGPGSAEREIALFFPDLV